jgi:hypothetical protein
MVAVVSILAASLVTTLAGPARESEVQSTRETLARWVETQQVISKEKQSWQLGKDVLEQRIALVGSEVASLEQKIAGAREQVAEADDQRRQLSAESGSLAAGTTSLTETVGALERKTQELLSSLPDPLRERLAPLSRRIPTEASTTTALSLSERFQNVIGILNEVNKFSAEISLISEIRPLSEGKTAEVQTLYVGLTQAYYVTPDGMAAGVGRPSPEGWVWTAANELASEISLAIDILQNEQVPAYVPLPVQIQ